MYKIKCDYSFGTILLPKVQVNDLVYVCMHCMWLTQLTVVLKFSTLLHTSVAKCKLQEGPTRDTSLLLKYYATFRNNFFLRKIIRVGFM